MGVFRERRERLAQRYPGKVLLFSGEERSRNYPANLYPFRASSHFLYFCGLAEPHAAFLLEEAGTTLFYDLPSADEAVWTGRPFGLEELLEGCEVDQVRPWSELKNGLGSGVAGLPPVDHRTAERSRGLLGREIDLSRDGPDRRLAMAVIELRLRHDAGALAQLREAARVTVLAHQTGMAACRPGVGEYQVYAEMLATCARHRCTTSFEPIVSVHGEVLHKPHRRHLLRAGDQLLADKGAETAEGWAGDVTRTYPVDGRFTPRQKDVYQAVLEAQRAAIGQIRPGVRYRDVHMASCRSLAASLVELGLLRGDADGLVERGAHTLFFPHGVGHLVGLDVHDMEDLGDLAGYAPGRQRSERFGLGYLRLDRDLEPGMLVTVEPGFYSIPELLDDPERIEPLRDCLDMERTQPFRKEVRGIRIEDEILVTESGGENLTAQLTKEVAEIESLTAIA
ncbi:MAG: aminopeptidase P family protein [Armatimonadetes bacterium]|nr:aminopeptidase P family protein [Armatimonadota bacterium]